MLDVLMGLLMVVVAIAMLVASALGWLDNEPDCTCFSETTDEWGEVLHYEDCLLIQHYIEPAP